MDDSRIELENMKQASGGYLAEDEMIQAHEDVKLELMLRSWKHRMDDLERIRFAADQQNGFFFSAMKRAGVL